VIFIHLVDCTTGIASLRSPSTARTTQTDLNPRRSAANWRNCAKPTFFRIDAMLPRGRVGPWPCSAAAPVLALVHGEPGHDAVGIRHHPGAGRQRRREDGLAPLEGVFGACRHDRYPHQQQEHTDLEG
jgi:hypothetical protein